MLATKLAIPLIRVNMKEKYARPEASHQAPRAGPARGRFAIALPTLPRHCDGLISINSFPLPIC
jgi:hypothetical protein